MGGRFIFLVFAAIHLSPEDLGRYGLIAGGVLIGVNVVGLEIYAVLHRRIIQGNSGEAADAASAYGWLIALAGATLTIMALAAGLAAGWTARLISLTAAVALLEYLGIEVMRTLIVYGYGGLSILNVFLRSGAWCIALPGLTLLNLVGTPWSIELVLLAWIASDLAGLLLVVPVLARIRPRLTFLPLLAVYLCPVLPTLAPWISATIAWRMIEVGGRFTLSLFHSDIASGRFTILSMLASLGLVGLRSVVEPLWFRRLIMGQQGVTKTFLQLSLLVLCAGAGVTVIGAYVYARVADYALYRNDWINILILLCGFGALGLSQVGHFSLYRAGSDRAILVASSFAALMFVLASLIAVPLTPEFGAAIALLIGALCMLIGKSLAALQMLPTIFGPSVQRGSQSSRIP